MGDLDSMKGIMDGRMSAMEESIAGLKSFHAEIGEHAANVAEAGTPRGTGAETRYSDQELLDFGP